MVVPTSATGASCSPTILSPAELLSQICQPVRKPLLILGKKRQSILQGLKEPTSAAEDGILNCHGENHGNSIPGIPDDEDESWVLSSSKRKLPIKFPQIRPITFLYPPKWRSVVTWRRKIIYIHTPVPPIFEWLSQPDDVTNGVRDIPDSLRFIRKIPKWLYIPICIARGVRGTGTTSGQRQGSP